jgi:hypothetical protein
MQQRVVNYRILIWIRELDRALKTGLKPLLIMFIRPMIQKTQSDSVRLGDNMSKNKLLNCLKLIFVIAIASTLFSCKSQSVNPQSANLEMLDPTLYDQSWLTGKPCGAPCWYGLEPGVSSRDDSISKVKQIPFIDGNTASFSNPTVFPYDDVVGFGYKKPQDSTFVELFFEKGILEEITFPLSYRITFEQAVEKLGTPDGFSVWRNEGDGYGCELQVVWKNKRLVLKYDTGLLPIISFGPNRDLCENLGTQPLPKGLLVQWVEIMFPSEIQSMTQANPTLAYPGGFDPWKGFAK